MVWTAVAAAAASAAGAGLSGIGASQAAAKQGRLQAIENATTNLYNEQMIAEVNRQNAALGEKLGKKLINSKLTETEHTVGSVTRTNASSSQTDNYSYVDVDRMMADADRAGFNPVTWLNAGGMQAYTQTGSHTDSYSEDKEITDMMVTRTSKGHNAAAGYQLWAQLASPVAYQRTAATIGKVPSPLEAAGDAISAGAKAGFAQYNEDADRQLKSDLLDRQIAAMNQAGSYKGSRSFYVPTTTSAGSKTSGKLGGGLSSTSTDKAIDSLVQRDALKTFNQGAEASGQEPQTSKTAPFWEFLWPGAKTDPTVPSAASAEDYGGDDMGGKWLFLLKTANDLRYNMTGKTWRQQSEELKANIGPWAKAFQDAGKATGDLGGTLWEKYYAPGFGIYNK